MVNTREMAAEYRLSHWAQIMKERVQSGLSIKAFCNQAEIHENTYFYWQKKLREATCTEVQAINAQNDTKALTSNGWATLRIESSSSAQSITIEVGGCRIAVRADTDTELLAKICRALKAI